MSSWVYFASLSKAGEQDTLWLARSHGLLIRSPRNRMGAAIAGVKHVSPGDRILICYTGVPKLWVMVLAPAHPVDGFASITRVLDPELHSSLEAWGYPSDEEFGFCGFSIRVLADGDRGQLPDHLPWVQQRGQNSLARAGQYLSDELLESIEALG